MIRKFISKELKVIQSKYGKISLLQDAQQSVKNNCAKGRKVNKVQKAKFLSDSFTPQNNSAL